MKRLLAIVTLATLLTTLSGVSASAQSASATMRLSPSSAAIDVGASTTIRVVINSPSQSINAAEATIRFPTNLLRATSVSKSGSIFTLWAVEPSISNNNGTVTFSGGRPSPGYRGSGGTVVSITFQGRAAGSAAVTITGARVLANDGEGTNILSGTSGSTITVRTPTSAPEPEPEPNRPAPTITSTTHPAATAATNSNTVQASWTAGSGVRGYSVSFDQIAGTNPDETSEGTSSTFTRDKLADGTWYLHVRAQYADGWSSTTHRAFRIDTTPPEPFTITADQLTKPGSVYLEFTATDPAGIARYELRLNEAAPVVVTSPHLIEKPAAGSYTAIIQAFDQAGNATIASLQFVVAELPAAFAVLELPSVLLAGEAMQTLVLGEPLIIRGMAPPGSVVHITVRSEESVFEFPVEDIIDNAPVDPVPTGQNAWKVTLYPALTPGQHEVLVDIRAADGSVVATAPTLKFRVLPPSLRIGSQYFPLRTLVIALAIAVGVLIVAVILFLILWRHSRRLLARNNARKAERDQGIMY